MQVLLFDEYSGLHLNLASGLRRLGVDVLFTSRGDEWKQIPSMNLIGPSGEGSFRRLTRGLAVLSNLRALSGHDVVQFISVDCMPPYLLKLVGNLNKRKYCLAAGSDSYAVLEFIRQPYSPLQAELLSGEHNLLRKIERKCIEENRDVVRWVDGVIPTGFTYYNAYANVNKALEPIPLPIDVAAVPCRPNRVRDKIRVFHGISRSAFKGTPLILKAMERLQSAFPDRVEIIVVKRIPFAEYLTLLDDSNVIVDQTYSYGYGMNALYGLAKGKIVLSGCEDGLTDTFGFEYCPVINVRPDEDQLFQTLSEIVTRDSREIRDLGARGRRFVEQYHAADVVARRFLAAWETQPA